MTNHTPNEYRDTELGAALSELDAPEHRPEFHRDLRRRLAAERSAVPHTATLRRRLRWAVPAAAVAAAAIALVAVGIPRTQRTPGIAGPQAASAAVVKSHLRTALTTMRNLSGVLVASGPAQGATKRWRFVLDAAGDVRLEGPAAGDVIAYDASTGVVRSAQHSASLGGPTLFYAEREGVAPGPPDQGPPTWILPEELGAYVRATLAANAPGVREIAYQGRPAWQLDVATVPNAIAPELSGDRFQITVDRQTGMPVRVVERKDGSLLRTLRIEQLAVDRSLPSDTFRLHFPAGAEVARSDDGFRRVELGRVAQSVGYRPLVPSWTPEGYRLAAVAVARESAPTGREGGNPPSRMVVSVSYRRGIDQFLVTTRLRGSGSWSDPLASPEGFVDRPQPVTFDSGALAGHEAQAVVSPRSEPHLWAQTDELVVTVGGDLSRAELTRVAGSLGSR
jgi:hypothetical protein